MPKLRLLHKDGNPLVHVEHESGQIDEVMFWNLGTWLLKIMAEQPHEIVWAKL